MTILLTITIFLMIQQNAFGYIDPGTGSLLFSVLIGVIGTLFFLSKSLIIKIKNYSFISNKEHKDKKANIIIYSEGSQYFNVFKSIVIELLNKNIKIIYYTSSEDDPIFEIKNEYLYSEFIGKGNKAYARLNMIEADICLMTTPNLDVFQLKRSKAVKKYVHIVHALNETSLYCLCSLDFYDAVLLNGENQIADIRDLESLRKIKTKEIKIIGSTYLDELSIKKDLLDKQEKYDTDTKTILIAPSWGQNGLLTKFGSKIIDRLTCLSNYNIIVRPHPQSAISEKVMLDNLMDMYKDNTQVKWDFDKDNIYSLHKSDILVSDFSGIMFDYAFLFEKPILIPEFNFEKRGTDANDLDYDTWTFKTLPKISTTLNDASLDDLENVINNALNDSKMKENIKSIRDISYMYRGESGARGANALLEILASLN